LKKESHFNNADLPIIKGRVYHLGLKPENLVNQGRTVSRIPLTVSEIDGLLSVVDTGIQGLRIENMEMEASFLLYFMSALGYRAGVVCVVIDNRCEDKFTTQYEWHISDASKVALRALATLQ
jgi:uridine phosphorylase